MEDSNSRIKCQICSQNTHLADRCPFSYTLCAQPNCNGIKILQISHEGRKFLKCQHSRCIGFEWLDEAILKRNAKGGCSSSISSCFGCDDTTHWIKDCPWKAMPCPTTNCNGIMDLKRSHSIENPDRPYLKCVDCNKFQWLNDAKDEKERNLAAAARMLGIDDICHKFRNSVNVFK